MAALTFQQITDVADLTPITLSASDTFTLPTSGRAFMQILGNASGTVTLTGEGVPVDVQVAGYGAATFAALGVTVADATATVQPLNRHAELLKGTVTVTGGESMTAYLYTV